MKNVQGATSDGRVLSNDEVKDHFQLPHMEKPDK